MALVSVFIGQVGVLVGELGVSELGPGPGLFVGETIGNGSRVAVEVEIGVAEDDDAGTSDEVTGVSKIGAVEQGLVMLSNGDQNLELNALKSEYWEHMIDTDSSGWTLAQVP